MCQRIAPPRQSRQANAPLLHSSQPLASPVPRSTSRGSPSRVRFPPRLPGRLRGNACRRTSGQIAGRLTRQTAPQPRHEQPGDNVCPVARPNGEQRHGPADGFACRDHGRDSRGVDHGTRHRSPEPWPAEANGSSLTTQPASPAHRYGAEACSDEATAVRRSGRGREPSTSSKSHSRTPRFRRSFRNNCLSRELERYSGNCRAPYPLLDRASRTRATARRRFRQKDRRA